MSEKQRDLGFSVNGSFAVFENGSDGLIAKCLKCDTSDQIFIEDLVNHVDGIDNGGVFEKEIFCKSCNNQDIWGHH